MVQNSVLQSILNNTDTIYYNTVLFNYYYGRNNSLINELFKRQQITLALRTGIAN